MSVALAVIAKAPRAGHSKTRLCPPCTPQQAADLAAAALADTLAAVAATPASRRFLVLDGDPGAWVPDGFEVIPQAGGGLDARLAAAFAAIGEPVFLVGMDTPQLTPALLQDGTAALARGASAVLGLADDGGYWGVGLQAPDAALFHGVPMSAGDTGVRQLQRLREHGHDPVLLDALRDVDHFADALAVAALAPGSRFAAAVAALEDQVAA
jgi:rSAM/selenodomain-associated transferase 1